MKKITVYLFLLLGFYSCSRPSVHYDEMILKDGLYNISTENKDTLPFTGNGFSTFDNGNVQDQTVFEKGIPIGISENFLHDNSMLSTTTHQLIELPNGESNGILRLNLLIFQELGSDKIYPSLNVITLDYLEDKKIIIEALKKLPILSEYAKLDIDCKLGEFESPYMNLTWYNGVIQ